MTVDEICNSFREIVGWPYESPGTNDKNGIDCSGAFVRAYNQYGLKIYHGSNRIERVYCHDCFDIGSVEQLKPGMPVFKYRNPDNSKYDLPDEYKKGSKYYNGDLRDYYHIGLVVSVNPFQIIHATTPKAKIDTALGNWKRTGYLNAVAYESEVEPMETLYQAKVATDGGNLRLRAEPSVASAMLAKMPNGATVDVLEECGNWAKVVYNNIAGYAFGKYLTKVVNNGEWGVFVPCESEEQAREIASLMGNVKVLRA